MKKTCLRRQTICNIPRKVHNKYSQSRQNYKHKMVDTQNMNNVITQEAIVTSTVAVQVIAVSRTELSIMPRHKSINMGIKLGRPALKQPTFDRNVTDKYTKLKNFILAVNNIFQTYITNYADRVTITKKLAK